LHQLLERTKADRTREHAFDQQFVLIPVKRSRLFLDERMKGDRPIMWGDQARQFRLNEIIYRDVLALDHAP